MVNDKYITNMDRMFYGSQTTSLDLSSFDTSNITYMTNMFASSKVTSGYARNKDETDKFNGLIGRAIFTVKN